MHTEHPVFKKPEDENVKIWRYMDFTKFVSMIDRKALFFVRADRLGDKFEGSPSKHIVEPSVEEKLTQEQLRQLEFMRNRDSWLYKAKKKEVVVNCWHVNECESAAMWKLHLKSEEGVAVQSTYRRLSDSFSNYEENEVWIGSSSEFGNISRKSICFSNF
jgi:capsid portal protein